MAKKENKKNTSLRLGENTLKALKIRAIENDSSVQSIVEELITEFLANRIKLKKRKK